MKDPMKLTLAALGASFSPFLAHATGYQTSSQQAAYQQAAYEQQQQAAYQQQLYAEQQRAYAEKQRQYEEQQRKYQEQLDEKNHKHSVELAPYKPGDKIRDGQLPAGYNQSAAYQCDTLNAFVSGDYLYWTWNQSSLQVGNIVESVTDTTVDTSARNEAIYNTPGYTSGFQVAAGFNMKGMDNWNLYSEYTWYRNSPSTTVTGTTAFPLVFAAQEFSPDDAFDGASFSGTFTREDKLGYQTLDFLAQRPFYFGKKLTANFSMGLRAQWMSHNFTKSSPRADNLTAGTYILNYATDAGQTLWSLGPKFAFDSNWLLGYGFKIMGNIAQSLLYTSYNTGNTISYTRSNGTSFYEYTQGLHNYGNISPVTESFIGLAWGSYFYDTAFHMDLSIGYNFNVYWNYNMTYAALSQTEGNMYLSGMNIKLRFDF